jgi:hypothetical protein
MLSDDSLQLLFVPRREQGLDYVADLIARHNGAWLDPVRLLEIDRDDRVYMVHGDPEGLLSDWLGQRPTDRTSWAIAKQLDQLIANTVEPSRESKAAMGTL